jgi:hypothetical protein
VLGSADIEYDLGNGIIRLITAKGCETQSLAYWSESGAFGPVYLLKGVHGSELVATAMLDDTKIRVLFDTGASSSILAQRTAAHLGISRTDAASAVGGYVKVVGSQRVETWIAPFKRLDLGGASIEHFRLRVGEIDPQIRVDLILGVDFFLSHRIYVASSQHRLFFTYNGGPVFDVNAH